MTVQEQYRFAEAFSVVAGELLTTRDKEDTLQRIVELAVATADGPDHAGITPLLDGRLPLA